MIKIDIFEYDKIDKSNKVFVFSLQDCGSCKLYEKELDNLPLEYYLVMTNDEEEFLKRELGFVPLTLYYNKKGEQVYKKYGTLFETQLTELVNIVKNG
jgi:hypothetical protein